MDICPNSYEPSIQHGVGNPPPDRLFVFRLEFRAGFRAGLCLEFEFLNGPCSTASSMIFPVEA
jgi:hypothetical protein